MKKLLFPSLAVLFVCATTAALQGAPTLAATVDLSPGADAYSPFALGINANTHKAYVLGGIGSSFQRYGLKVIDTTSGQAVTGVDLGFSTSSNDTTSFVPLGLAIDDSTSAGGNRAYIVGSPGGGRHLFMRFVDTANNTALTGPGTDLDLPGTTSFQAVVVNPLNHKIYVSDSDGKIAVINGPSRQTVGSVSGTVIAPTTVFNPATNKFITTESGSIFFLDSSSDTGTNQPIAFNGVRGAALDAASGRLYVLAFSTQSSKNFAFSLFVVDANSGAILSSTANGVTKDAKALAFDSASQTLYASSPNANTGIGNTTAFDAATLAIKKTFPHSGNRVVVDGRLFLLGSPETPSAVGILSPANSAFSKTTVGYRPGVLAANAQTGRVYVADQAATEVTAIDSASGNVVGRFQVAADVNNQHVSIATSAALNRFYLTHLEYQNIPNSLGSVQVAFLDSYDGADGHLIASTQLNQIDTSGSDGYVAVDDNHRRIYVSGFATINGASASALFVIDADSNSLVATIKLGSTANGVAVNPVTRRVYVSNGSGSVGQITIIDGATNAVVTSVPAASISPGQVVVNSKTNKAYVATTNGNNHSVQIIDGDAAAGTFSDTSQNQFDSASRVAVDEVTNTVYVIDDSLSSIDYTSGVLAFDAAKSYQRIAQIELGVGVNAMTFDPVTHRLFVSNGSDGTGSVLQGDAGAPSSLANIATRLKVGTGDNVLIAGFIVTGSSTATKTVLLRGIGPSLKGLAGTLSDPFLELHDSSGAIIASNDDWQQGNTSKIPAGFQPGSPKESVLVATIAAGTASYTAVLKGAHGETGVGVVEAYDLDGPATAQLANIATRGLVNIGDDVLIAGLIVGGDNSASLLLRAISPSLQGISGALQNPSLTLVDSNGNERTNLNWRDDATQAAEIQATGAAPTDNREAALRVSLPPGNYTAIVRGEGNTTGVAVVEVYNLR